MWFIWPGGETASHWSCYECGAYTIITDLDTVLVETWDGWARLKQ